MPNQLALPESTDLKSFWSRPEGKTAMLIYAGIIGVVVFFWGEVSSWVLNMLDNTVHIGFLCGVIGAAAYLVFGKRPQLMFRVLVRKLTSLFVAVYPIEIIEDKLLQMKKRRDKMNEQISLVKGSITKLQRVISQGHADAVKGFGMASQAQKMAGATQDENERLRMQLAMKQQARRAQRREQSNIGYQNLLERLTKVYNFLTRYAINVDYFIDDTQDEIDQKKTEYETTNSAFGAMKQAMAVIRGNATEEDIYNQAFDQIETTVSTQLGMMDDLQRMSQNFMDGMDVETGSVDEAALQALNAFEQKTLTAGTAEQVMTADKSSAKLVPVPVSGQRAVNGDDLSDLLK
jgi:hypothetical protein